MQIAGSGSAQTLLAIKTTAKGPVAPAKGREAFAKMPGGVTVGKPQDAPSTSTPDTDKPGAVPGVAVGGPKQQAQATPVGGLSVTWKPTLYLSDQGPIEPIAAAAAGKPALKKARWEKASSGGWDDKKRNQPTSSEWHHLRMCCTRCGGLDHVAAFCPTAEAMAVGAAETPEATTEAATSVGGPPGDPPAEETAEAADAGESQADTGLWTPKTWVAAGTMSSQADRPTGDVVADAVADESYARYRASSSVKQKGYITKARTRTMLKANRAKARSPATKRRAKAKANKTNLTVGGATLGGIASEIGENESLHGIHGVSRDCILSRLFDGVIQSRLDLLLHCALCTAFCAALSQSCTSFDGTCT